MNVHKKCASLVGNTCGIDQKKLSEILDKLNVEDSKDSVKSGSVSSQQALLHSSNSEYIPSHHREQNVFHTQSMTKATGSNNQPQGDLKVKFWHVIFPRTLR